jgi:hypothetical protein
MGERVFRDPLDLALTVVKNEANDDFGTWSIERGADRLREVLTSKGWSVGPDAGTKGLRAAIEEELAMLGPEEERPAFEAGAAAAYNYVLSKLGESATPEDAE